MKISEHFSDYEFFKDQTLKEIENSGHEAIWHIPKELLERLERIREYFNSPVHISSGYRTQKENIQAGSEQEYSFHKEGKAADIVVEGKDPKDVQAYIRKTWNNGGLGCGSTFTHIDIRNSNQLVEWEYV